MKKFASSTSHSREGGNPENIMPESELSNALDITAANAPTAEAEVMAPEFTPEVQNKLDHQLDVARKFDADVKNAVMNNFECAKMIGQIQAFDAVHQFSGIGRLVMLRQVKESKAYKGVKVPQPDGSTLEINTFDQFCELMGTSYSKVAEDLQNLNVFGESCLDSLQKMGLGYRQLRQLRALPEDERKLVIEGEAVGSSDPEVLKDLIEELAAKRAKDKKELEEAKANHAAQGEVLAKKNKALDAAQTELAKLKNIPPDKKIAVRAERETAALKELHMTGIELLGVFAKFEAKVLGILNDEELSRHAAEQAVTLTSGLCSRMADSLIEDGIDIDFRILAYPPELGDLPLRGDAERMPEGEPQ